jgi:DNA (cytosine-5)-methyltransferase 1
LLQGVDRISPTKYLNNSLSSNNPTYGDLKAIPQLEDVPEKFYISPKACKGILRRKNERSINMNGELEILMQKNTIVEKEEKTVRKKAYDAQIV